MNFQINPEDRDLLKNLIQELETLNENLSDLKTMLAPWLGFKISEKELERRKHERR